jgi:phage terminase Nu1 subunit (DNA packaging protein)
MSWKTITLQVDNEGQEALVRSYHALVVEMGDLAQSAPSGQVLDQLEELAVEKGRETLRATLAQAVQARVDAAEKKGRSCGSAHAVSSARTAAPRREPS